MLIILFGLAGTGKNYIGHILANHFDYHYWDADEDLSSELQHCIQTKTSFDQTMRDTYTQTIIKKIARLLPTHPNLVISQALYKEANRIQIKEKFPHALFIWIKANDAIILNRLKSRQTGIDSDYAKKIASHFEPPKLTHVTIENEFEKEFLVKRLKEILSSHNSK